MIEQLPCMRSKCMRRAHREREVHERHDPEAERPVLGLLTHSGLVDLQCRQVGGCRKQKSRLCKVPADIKFTVQHRAFLRISR